MAYWIDDGCTMCGACAAGCPGNAIYYEEGIYAIAPEACMECGYCEMACPNGCALPDDEGEY